MPNVVGLFDSRSEAHSTVQQLVNSGFDREDISLVSQDTDRQSNDGKTHPGISGSDLSIPKDDTSGALKGAGIGAAVGGIGGLLAGIAGLAIPVIGPIVAAGPIAAALTAALGGAGVGAVTRGLVVRFPPRPLLVASAACMIAASSGAVLLMLGNTDDTAVPIPQITSAADALWLGIWGPHSRSGSARPTAASIATAVSTWAGSPP